MSVKAHTQYRVNGKVVPGVTTVIGDCLGWNKRVLISWARKTALEGNDPDAVLRSAGVIGKASHKLIEGYLKGEQPYLGMFSQAEREPAENALVAFKSWAGNRKLEFRHVEFEVISVRYLFGGTIDVLAVCDGRLLLIDLKTGSGLYPEFIVQVAAYGKAYTEQTGEKIDEYHLLRLSKTGSGYGTMLLTEGQVEAGWEAFKHCRALWDLKKELMI